MKGSQCLICFILFLFGCQKYYVSVTKDVIGRDHLASSFVDSPDPLQAHPPSGNELLVKWRLPYYQMQEPLNLVVDIIYKNYTQKTITVPLTKRQGYYIYRLLNKEYEETGGLLTYKAAIINSSQQVLQEWEQLLWVQLIDVNTLHNN